jgi:hypothetical protein
MKIGAGLLNMMHHFLLFIAFVYWLKTDNTFMSFGIMATSIIIGYFIMD